MDNVNKENNNKKRKSFSVITGVIIAVLVILIFWTIVYFFNLNDTCEEDDEKITVNFEQDEFDYETEEYEYYLSYTSGLESRIIKSFEEYDTFTNEFQKFCGLKPVSSKNLELLNGVEKNFFKENNLAIVILSLSDENKEWLLSNVSEENDVFKAECVGENYWLGIQALTGYEIYLLPTSKSITNIIVQKKYYNVPTMEDKPVIYLYPTENTKVSVKLENKDNITCSYPKYEDGWTVMAQTNGDLIDLTTNRRLYSLYYEAKNAIEFKVENEGFVIKGEDSTKFLEEKLEILGLNYKEAEEFIIYWLPKLEANKYNYIRFATKEEIDENMPLLITPKPDTVIRVLMIFKGLDKKIDVKEQRLIKVKRTGFSTVEWGGVEI